MDRTQDPYLPAVHALHLADLVAERWQVQQDALFEGSGLVASDLAAPGARIALPAATKLAERARSLTKEPAIGVYLGLQMRVSAHGFLGFAAMTSATLHEAIELAVRFAPTRTNALHLSHARSAGQAELVIEERADFGAARDTVLFALTLGLWQIASALTGTELEGQIDLTFSEPSYGPSFPALSKHLRYGQRHNRLTFDAALLDLRLEMADAVATRLAREQCERALESMGDRSEARWLEEVRRVMRIEANGPLPTLEEAATRLHVSTRTLKRRLASSNTSYSDLLREERFARATTLLRSTSLSIDEISERSGYSDVANFTRAFRRWAGTTPTAYRRRPT